MKMVGHQAVRVCFGDGRNMVSVLLQKVAVVARLSKDGRSIYAPVVDVVELSGL